MSAEFWDAWLNVCMSVAILAGLVGFVLALVGVDPGEAVSDEGKVTARRWARNLAVVSVLCAVTTPFIIELRHDATPEEIAPVVVGRR